MLEYRENLAEKIIELDIGGDISTEEVENFVKNVKPRIAEWGKIKLLQRISDIPSVSPGAVYTDLKFLAEHTTGFDRCAVIADHKLIEQITKLIDAITPNDIKTFTDEITAREWLLAA